MRNTPFGEMPEADWYFTITNELHVVYHPTREAWPYLVKRGDVRRAVSARAGTGTRSDVARLAAILASDDAGYINRAEIVIDGDITAMAR